MDRPRADLRLELGREGREAVAEAADPVPRRDAARRHPVAVGGRSVDRRQAPARRPRERPRHRHDGHRAARRRQARGRGRHDDRRAHPRRQAARQGVLRRAHARQRHPGDRRHLAEGRHRDRGAVLHRHLADPPVRRGLGPRADAEAVGRRDRSRPQVQPAGRVRHRGHHALAARGADEAVHERGRARRAAA